MTTLQPSRLSLCSPEFVVVRVLPTIVLSSLKSSPDIPENAGIVTQQPLSSILHGSCVSVKTVVILCEHRWSLTGLLPPLKSPKRIFLSRVSHSCVVCVLDSSKADRRGNLGVLDRGV